MKVLTLNCHAWQEENQMEKIKHLAQVIKEKQYDVIALQEVMQLIDETTEEKVKKRKNTMSDTHRSPPGQRTTAASAYRQN